MGGYYRMGPSDARRLASMIAALSTDRSRVNRALMTLYCWSQMQAKGTPCPYFQTGVRTIARECEVTPRAVQRFMERAQEEGFIVGLGESTTKGGRYTRRTFWWVAEEAAEEAGMDLGEWLRKVGGVTHDGYTGVTHDGYTGGYISQHFGLHGCNPTPTEPQVEPPVFGGMVTHQSTEYSEEGRVALSADAERAAPFDSVSENADGSFAAAGGVRVAAMPGGA